MSSFPFWWEWILVAPDAAWALFVTGEVIAVVAALLMLMLRPAWGSILIIAVLVTSVTVSETAGHALDYKHAKQLADYYESVSEPVHAEHTLTNYRDISYWEASRRYRDVRGYHDSKSQQGETP